MRPIGFTLCVGVCTLALTTAVLAQPRERSAFSQPLHDLGMMREQVPEILARAATSPYAELELADGRTDCRAVVVELAALDDALGPDLNLQIRNERMVGNFVSGAIRDALDLPYSGVVRRLSGAERRDREMRNAVQAGTVRRAFLKGVRDSACTIPIQPVEQQSLASVATVQYLPAFAEPTTTLAASEEAPAPVRAPETSIALTQVSATAQALVE